MEYNTIPRTSLRVSKICLGTMTFGQQNDLAESHRIIDAALDRGVNFLDAAEMYPVPARADTQGRTEEYLGEWLKDRPRDSVVLATKVAGPGRQSWIRGGPKLNREQIRQALEDSLRRLQTDYVDLYQIHWPSRRVPLFGGWEFATPPKEEVTGIEEQMEVMADLVTEGKVRAFGLSNETPYGLKECLEVSRRKNLPSAVTLQNSYSLVNRTFDTGLSEICHWDQVGLLAYSPLAFGYLSGKYLKDPNAAGRMTLFPDFGGRFRGPNFANAVRDYCALAAEYSLSPAQFALAFVNRNPQLTANIIGATTVAQVEENIGSVDVTFTDEMKKAVDAIHLRYPTPAP